MSQIRRTTCSVTDSKLLTRACDRARAAGIQLVGPRYEANYPGEASGGRKAEAWLVQLPGNIGGRSVVFYCNPTGDVQRDVHEAYGGSEKAYQRLLSEYSVAVMEEFAEQQGCTLQVTAAEDGIQLEMELEYEHA